MTQKNGAIIHVERGYRIVEVLEDGADVAERFAGYRVLGHGAEQLPVFLSLAEAVGCVAVLAAQNHDPHHD